VSRSAQKAAEQSSEQQQQQQMANQNADRASRDQAVNNYTSTIENLTKTNPWLDPEYQKNVTSLAAGNSAGVGASTEEAARNYGLKTGTNSAVLAPALAEMGRERTRQLATDTTDQLQSAKDKGVELQKWGAQALGQIPGIYTGSASTDVSGLNSANSLLGDAAKTPGFWDQILNTTIGAAGNAAGAISKACVVAAACFGEYDLRTRIMRLWMNHVFVKRRFGKHIVAAYIEHGPALVRFAEKHRAAKALFSLIFNAILPTAGRELTLIGRADG
jgi:hypothetical protein